jgi:hypothetical protein
VSFDAGSIEASLTLDRDPFNAGLRAARKDADDFERRKVTATVDADTTRAKQQLRSLPDPKVQVQVATERLAASLAGVLRQVGSFKVTAVASLVALVPAAVGAATAVGGIGVAAAAAAAPFGLLGLAIKQAMKAGTDEAKAFKQQTDLLTVAFGAATRDAANAALTGMSSALHDIRSVLPGLRDNFTGLGEEAGRSFTQLGQQLGSTAWRDFYALMIDTAAKALPSLTDALGSVLDIVRNIATAGMPLFLRAVRGLADALGDLAKRTSNVEALRASMERGAGVMGKLWQIAKNLAGVLGGVFSAATSGSASFLNSIVTATADLSKFFRSTEGQKILKDTLAALSLFVEEIIAAIPAAVRAFGALLNIITPIFTAMMNLVRAFQKLPGGGVIGALALGFVAWKGPIGAAVALLKGIPLLLGRIKAARVTGSLVGTGGVAGAAAGRAAPAVVPINTAAATASAKAAGSTAGRAGFIAGLVAALASGRARIASTIGKMLAQVGPLFRRIPGLGAIAGVIGGGFSKAAPVVRTAVSKLGPLAAGALKLAGKVVVRGIFGWPGLIASVIWMLLPQKLKDSIKRAVGNALGAFKDAGVNLVKAIGSGIKAAAEHAIIDPIVSVLQKARNMLPFSEPRDSSSPMMRLGKSGEAMMGNVGQGIKAAQGRLVDIMKSALAPVQQAAKGALATMDFEDAARNPTQTRGQREAEIMGRISAARYATDDRGRLLNQPPPGVQRRASRDEREAMRELEDFKRSNLREDLESVVNVDIQALVANDPRVLAMLQTAIARAVQQGRRRRPGRALLA